MVTLARRYVIDGTLPYVFDVFEPIVDVSRDNHMGKERMSTAKSSIHYRYDPSIR
jgi:hypothetical protein